VPCRVSAVEANPDVLADAHRGALSVLCPCSHQCRILTLISAVSLPSSVCCRCVCQSKRIRTYGLNRIEVPRDTLGRLLFNEMVTPFFLFQARLCAIEVVPYGLFRARPIPVHQVTSYGRATANHASPMTYVPLEHARAETDGHAVLPLPGSRCNMVMD
jgi:hypothetical protein